MYEGYQVNCICVHDFKGEETWSIGMGGEDSSEVNKRGVFLGVTGFFER